MSARERDPRRGPDAVRGSRPARARRAGDGTTGKAASGKGTGGASAASGKGAGRSATGRGKAGAAKAGPAKAGGRPAARRPQSRARSRAGAGTGGAFGMTGTRRAALLAMVVCALALSIAVPLRTYLAQREELREVTASQETLRAEVAQLEQRKQELADPAHVEAEARRRLHYVRPGETPYVVQLPGDAERELEERRPATEPAEDKAWYEQLWDSAAAR
ncbi:FtsB family cell division protein [Saccharothrix yanglingensis]|uniref:Septum formation initiator n=1 Tax=Saccharothrix yanglingensis TaxID=659496 RepID=A0ABU0WXT0_9PSEU|nr:septum formation initiator family protein [Saccharothrix yanglingensis]MDQ2584662.1 septum formation initiator [Saccharothrix yanglingensis]